MKRQARAVAEVRRHDAASAQRMSLIAAIAAALAIAAMSLAHAQTTVPAPLPPKSSETGPTVPPAANPGGGSTGVIRPPAAVDPGMAHKAPNVGTMPVIPPPGTSGDANRVVPK